MKEKNLKKLRVHKLDKYLIYHKVKRVLIRSKAEKRKIIQRHWNQQRLQQTRETEHQDEHNDMEDEEDEDYNEKVEEEEKEQQEEDEEEVEQMDGNMDSGANDKTMTLSFQLMARKKSMHSQVAEAHVLVDLSARDSTQTIILNFLFVKYVKKRIQRIVFLACYKKNNFIFEYCKYQVVKYVKTGYMC